MSLEVLFCRFLHGLKKRHLHIIHARFRVAEQVGGACPGGWWTQNFGWWFGTRLLFSHILGILISDFHIVLKGRYTTNQKEIEQWSGRKAISETSRTSFETGWWFGTFFIFPYIGNNHPN